MRVWFVLEPFVHIIFVQRLLLFLLANNKLEEMERMQIDKTHFKLTLGEWQI